MKKLFCLLALITVVFVGCTPVNTSQGARIERGQQELGIQALLRNQPIPDLGGYSFERAIMIQLEVARNKGNVSTYSYTMTLDGHIIEICASKGFPIPYATQLTNPLQPDRQGQFTGGAPVAIGNPEPNGLYPPPSAAGTWIACVNSDGSVSPQYWEPNVFALPYRIKSDIQLQRLDSTVPQLKVDAPK